MQDTLTGPKGGWIRGSPLYSDAKCKKVDCYYYKFGHEYFAQSVKINNSYFHSFDQILTIGDLLGKFSVPVHRSDRSPQCRCMLLWRGRWLSRQRLLRWMEVEVEDHN